MKKTVTASRLKVILFIALLLIFILGTGGFYFAQAKMTEYAQSISQLNADAGVADENIAAFRRIQTYLDIHQPAVNKAGSIVADSRSYAYQDQIIDDISAIGRKSNIAITGFNFAGGSDGSTAGAAAPSAPAATAAPTATALGIKSVVANVTIDSTAEYDDILSFIKAIERNPTKMQIEQVSLVKDEGSKVTSNSFSIEVYVR